MHYRTKCKLRCTDNAFRIGVIIAALFFGTSGIIGAADFNVLMIGNSYVEGTATARDVSLDLQGLFNADPQHSATVTKYAVGGGTLKGRVNDPAVTGPLGLLGDPNYAWDVVILQERSLRPALATKNGGSELAGLDDGGPVLINDYIKVNHPQAEVLLYNTWSRELGNSSLVNDFNNDPNEMLLYTNLGYDRIQENPGSWDHSDVAEIARVGDAWKVWYDEYGYFNNSIDLHESDGSHQNDRGGYLAAAVLFEMITGSTTVGNTYSGAVSGMFGGNLIVSLLQEQATAVTGVGENADFDSSGSVNGFDFLTWQEGFGINNTAQHANGDANNDGNVDWEDLIVWEAQYENQPLSAFSSVPEPSCLTLGACLILCASRAQRRQVCLYNIPEKLDIAF